MKKNEFKKIIKELVSIKEDEELLNKALKKFEPDFNYICFGRYEDLIVKTLEIAMDDTSEWISYWLYDCECGKKSLGKVKIDGKVIPLKTIEDLYNCTKIKNKIPYDVQSIF